jgi:hypothetical protein
VPYGVGIYSAGRVANLEKQVSDSSPPRLLQLERPTPYLHSIPPCDITLLPLFWSVRCTVQEAGLMV